jgi:segregation and condensation protein A
MVMDVGQLIPVQGEKTGFSYTLQQFEGPLDLLLYLIQKAQVNIYDIPISEITDQFLAYLDLAKQMDLNDLTDFYLMASHLLLIKSRMLLPHDDALNDDEELSDPRIELVERLLEYQKYKKYTELLSDSSQTGELFIQRKKSQFMLPFDDQELWSEVSVWDLLKTFSSLLKSVTPEQVFNVYEEVTTKQKLSLMYELFEYKEEISFMDIVVRPNSPMDVICAFLAILEAVKFHLIAIFQHSLFGDIVIRKRDEFSLDAIEEGMEDEEFEGEADSFSLQEQKGSDNGINSIQSHYEDLDDDDEIIEFDDDETE